MENRMPAPRASFDVLVQIVRSEFLEMPGMRLTPPQMRRLWHLDDEVCDQLTRYLIDDGFLAEDKERRLHCTGVGIS
jgi:hypothetical protein